MTRQWVMKRKPRTSRFSFSQVSLQFPFPRQAPSISSHANRNHFLVLEFSTMQIRQGRRTRFFFVSQNYQSPSVVVSRSKSNQNLVRQVRPSVLNFSWSHPVWGYLHNLWKVPETASAMSDVSSKHNNTNFTFRRMAKANCRYIFFRNRIVDPISLSAILHLGLLKNQWLSPVTFQ
jgi:hypothetical protein